MADEEKLKEYIEHSKPLFQEGMELIQDMLGWTRVGDESEIINCFRRPNEGSDVDIFKAEVYYDGPVEKVSRWLFDNWGFVNKELTPEDSEKFERIKEFNPNARTSYSLSKPKGPVSACDGVSFGMFLPIGENSFAQISHSIDSDIPVPEGVVRAEMRLAVHLYE